MLHHEVRIGRLVHFYSTTGVVQEAGKRSETHISASGGGSTLPLDNSPRSNVHISSTTTVHDDFFIVDDEGTEHAYQLANFDVAVRKGNRITVTHAIRSNKQRGPYVLVQNHSTRKDYFAELPLRNAFRPSLLICLAIGIVAALVSITILGCFAPFSGFVPFIVADIMARHRVKEFKRTFNFSQLAVPAPATTETLAAAPK